MSPNQTKIKALEEEVAFLRAEIKRMRTQRQSPHPLPPDGSSYQRDIEGWMNIIRPPKGNVKLSDVRGCLSDERNDPA